MELELVTGTSLLGVGLLHPTATSDGGIIALQLVGTSLGSWAEPPMLITSAQCRAVKLKRFWRGLYRGSEDGSNVPKVAAASCFIHLTLLLTMQYVNPTIIEYQCTHINL